MVLGLAVCSTILSTRGCSATLRRLLKYSRYRLGVQIDLTQFEWGALQYEEAEERNREFWAAANGG